MAYQRSRKGSPEDRGKVLPWKTSKPADHSGLASSIRHVLFNLASGSADVDPTLVLTATVVGAAYAYSLLWVVVLCIPFLITVFAVSTRLGSETHKGLVHLIRDNYGRGPALACAITVIAINFTMIVADLMAVSDGLAIMLGHQRMFFVALVAFSVWYILILHDYRYITRIFLWLTLPLLIYIPAAIIATLNTTAPLVASTFVPRIPRSPEVAGATVAIFGSLLTPYVLVWRTSSRREWTQQRALLPGSYSYAGRILTCVLAYCIIVATGSVLHLPFASNMTTLHAAEALRIVTGDVGPYMFALGLIAAGMVALPVLVATMSYSLSEAMGWRTGLTEHPWEAKSFYVLISLTMLTAGVLNFAPVNPVRAAYLSQVLAGILAIPILLFILILSNDRRVMQTANTRWQNFWFGAAIGGLAASGLLLVWWKMS
ncbi:MAG: NRAMP family divalent metal transporter [Terriglobales bacterium]